MSQNARERAMGAFSAGQAHVMVATDIAARGIDVSGVELVVHVDPPAEHKAYLHRSGRTARAGASGTVVTLVLPEQKHDVQVLLKKAKIKADIERVRPDDDVVAALVGEVAPKVAVEDMPEGVAIKGGAPAARRGGARQAGGAGKAGGAGRSRGGRQSASRGSGQRASAGSGRRQAPVGTTSRRGSRGRRRSA